MMNTPAIVCVLGPPRCGTSLTTRILNLLGVDLGSRRHVIETKPANAKGDWEHVPIRRLNDDLLAELGGSWFDPPDFRQGWAHAAALARFRAAAGELIKQDFSDSEVWGWKDPRTCLTLPFWQQLLPSMRCVICLRDPMEMAQSLRRYVNCSLEHGIYLWLVYMRAAFQHTANTERVVVSFRDLLVQPESGINVLARIAGAPDAVENSARVAAGNFIDRNEWHQRSPDMAQLSESQCLPAVIESTRKAFEAVRCGESLDPDAMDTVFSDALSIVAPVVKKWLHDWKTDVGQWMDQ